MTTPYDPDTAPHRRVDHGWINTGRGPLALTVCRCGKKFRARRMTTAKARIAEHIHAQEPTS